MGEEILNFDIANLMRYIWVLPILIFFLVTFYLHHVDPAPRIAKNFYKNPQRIKWIMLLHGFKNRARYKNNEFTYQDFLSRRGGTCRHLALYYYITYKKYGYPIKSGDCYWYRIKGQSPLSMHEVFVYRLPNGDYVCLSNCSVKIGKTAKGCLFKPDPNTPFNRINDKEKFENAAANGRLRYANGRYIMLKPPPHLARKVFIIGSIILGIIYGLSYLYEIISNMF